MEGEEGNLTQREVEDAIEKLVEDEVESPIEERVEKTIEGEAEESVEQEAQDPLEELVERQIENEVEKSVEQKVGSSKEELVEETADKQIKNYKKKFLISTIVVLCTLIIGYFSITVHFMNHFYFNSEMNGIDISAKSVEDVELLMKDEIQGYRLNLKKRGGKSEQIKGVDVGLRYNSEDEFKKLKSGQNPFTWFLAYFNTEDFKMTVDVTYDEQLLKEQIEKLTCFESGGIIEPKNPSIQYADNRYIIVDEIPGNKVDKDLLYTHVADGLIMKESEIDLEAINCYIEPQYHSKSEKIIEAQDILNKYLASKVTYTFAGSEEVLEGSTINKWLAVNENFSVTVDEKQIGDYIELLSEKYNTTGTTRNFRASSGEIVQIGGGDFSRPINKVVETQNLISAIKKGETITKEPVYGLADVSYGNSDIGDTYAEIDLINQHIWFYKRGSLIVEGDIVTGNVRAGHTTPKGVYSLKYKAKNAVLRGPGYAAPVSFWMPFNGGIGMHDANWRSAFGGNIYKADGSHGCINCPRNVAEAIYNNIEPGTPVICY